MMKSFRFVVPLICFGFMLSTICFAGPFGFIPGTTKAQVIAQVGASHIKERSDGFTLSLNTAPKPNAGFETYVLKFSTSKGLVKIIAIGVDIESPQSGSEVLDKFKEVEEALTSTYGAPTNQWNFVHAHSLWTEPSEWMMSLLKKERTVVSGWDAKGDAPSIILEANPSSLEKAWLSISYEYPGFSELAAEIKSKQNSVF